MPTYLGLRSIIARSQKLTQFRRKLRDQESFPPFLGETRPHRKRLQATN